MPQDRKAHWTFSQKDIKWRSKMLSTVILFQRQWLTCLCNEDCNHLLVDCVTLCLNPFLCYNNTWFIRKVYFGLGFWRLGAWHQHLIGFWWGPHDGRPSGTGRGRDKRWRWPCLPQHTCEKESCPQEQGCTPWERHQFLNNLITCEKLYLLSTLLP